MISNHLKKGLWLWIAACVLLWICSKQSQFQQYADEMARFATFGLWGGAAMLGLTPLTVGYVEHLRAGKRLTELHRRVQSGETIEIRGGSGLPRLIVMMTVAWVILSALSSERANDFDALRQGLFIAGVATLALLELLTVLPLLRAPILRISRETLESPVFGKLSWRDIHGLELGEARIRGFTLHHRLRLVIPGLPRLTQQMHPATRLSQHIRSIFRPCTELCVRLVRPSEMPKVILVLCQRTRSGSMHNPTDVSREDEFWEMRVTPPRNLIRTHWATWIATAIAAVVMAYFVYLLYSAPV